MFVKSYMTVADLVENCWSGAEKVARRVEELGLEEELLTLMEDIFHGSIPELVEVNDFLRFEGEYIAEALDVDPEEF